MAKIVDTIEETLIALLLGLMTIITFANVIARYVFNTNLLWALETTVFLFAWLVLLGAAYCVKTRAHLGVDVIVNLFGPVGKRRFAIAAGLCSIVFSLLLAIGSWEYWLPFATKNVWYEVNDIRIPEFLRFLEDAVNEGEAYEKLPRFIPYFALPLGMTLVLLRFIQATWKAFRGEWDVIIASHEVEDLIEESATQSREN